MSRYAPWFFGLLMAMGTLVSGVGVGCRAQRAPTPEAKGIGFRLDDDPDVASGAIITEPAGREEGFLPFVVGGVPAWVRACAREAGRSPLTFAFGTDENGGLRAVPQATGASARARCVAARAAGANATSLAGGTVVTIEVVLSGRGD